MQLHGHQGEIEAKGAKLHLIGNGGPSFIAGFREITGFTGAIYTDPGLKTYAAAGLLRSVRATLGLRSLAAGIKSMSEGRHQGARQGDAWQQGGALVVNSAGEILFSQRSESGGDNVSPEALLAALDS